MRRWLAAVVLLTACGGSQEAVGHSDPEPERVPVELELRTPDGVWIHVGGLRGRPVLLYLFATFDGVSQAALRPISRFVRHHPDVHVVGISVQPEARQLLDAWATALEPPFPVTYDPEERILDGTSDLGEVDRIPTYVLLDERGYEATRHVGFGGQRRLDRMLWQVRPEETPGPATPAGTGAPADTDAEP